jgi:hypothetical protein
MLQHDLFPIHRLPPRIRRAIVTEFQGRCPTVLEVASVPDTDWLTVPDIGPTMLAKLRSLTPGVRRNAGLPSLVGLPDEELLTRSKSLMKELDRVRDDLRAHRIELQIRGIPLPWYYLRAQER